MDILISLLADASATGDTIQSLISNVVTADDPTRAAFDLPGVLEYGALITGAVSGAMTGCGERLDIMGVAALAMVTGLGGGLLRDIILPTGSVYMIDNPASMLVCIIFGIAAFFFSSLFYKLDRPIAVVDIVSVALFAVVGADKTLMAGYSIVACVFLGTITAVGGGMLRDICLGRTPSIFKSGNFYAICALLGAIVYSCLVAVHCTKLFAAAVSVVATIGVRWLSLHYNIVTLTPVDLTPRIMGPIRRMVRHGAADGEGRPRGKGDREEFVSFAEDPNGGARKG